MSASRIRRCSIFAAVAALAMNAGCGKKDAGDEKKDESTAEVAAVTAEAQVQPFTEVVGAIGTVVPRAGHLATLSAPAATRVTNVLVAAGQAVTKGQSLVELEQTGFQTALRSAAATQASARAARDRAQRLVEQGISPQKDLDQSRADLAKADADVTVAQRMLELSVLRSPIAGVVTRMSTSLGASVDPSQTLVEIADPAALDVLLSVQPADAARIKGGNAVRLHSGQRPTADPLASGSVVDVAGVIDSASRSVPVRVHANSSHRPLRIGETLFGEVVVAVRPKAVTVPIEALVPEGDGFKVFVVDSASVAHAQLVTIGGKTDKIAEILKGVAGGDRVVTQGAFGVEDGAKIVAPDSAHAAKPAAPDSAAKP